MSTLSLVVSTSIAVLLGAIAPPILDGVERKVKAIFQSRVGPPITQTLYDLLKLSVKETKPMYTKPFVIGCLLSFVSCGLVSQYLISTFAITRDSTLLAFSLSYLAISLSALTLTPLLVPNPFSYIGGMREILLALVNESSFITSIVVYTVALSTFNNTSHFAKIVLGSLSIALAFAAMIISGYALAGRVPYDIAEAEPELASGVYVEFSGHLLALYLYSNLLKRFLVKLFIATLIAVSVLGPGLITLITAYALTLLLWIAFASISVVLGRSRVDVAPRTLAKVNAVLLATSTTIALVVAYAGL